jgi:hypothetical protein
VWSLCSEKKQGEDSDDSDELAVETLRISGALNGYTPVWLLSPEPEAPANSCKLLQTPGLIKESLIRSILSTLGCCW